MALVTRLAMPARPLSPFVRRLLLPVLLLLASCDGGGPEPPPSLSADWQGTVASRGSAYTFTLGLVESGSVVSGDGTLTSGGTTARFTVGGSYVHPDLQLRLTFTDRPPVTLSGQVDDGRDEIAAQVTGAGFGGEAFTLTRL